MSKHLRELIVSEYYLRKLYFFCRNAQQDLFNYKPPITTNNDDARIALLGYVRTIIFSAHNDAIALARVEQEKPYTAYRKMFASENFSDEIQFDLLSSYAVYNFIVRIYSILESGNKTFFNKPKFNDYLKQFDPKLVSGYEILRAFRNTIHNNGKYLPPDGKVFSQTISSYTVVINPGDTFDADLKLLYLCSKAGIDLFKQIAEKDIDERPHLIQSDNQYRAY